MNALQAAYDILVTLSIIDGDFDEAEGQVILDFLNDNFDGSFDPHASNARLQALDAAAIRAHFDEAAAIFRDATEPEDREALLEFGIDLIMSDDELTEDENALVRKLSALWDVPLQPLVARAMDVTE